MTLNEATQRLDAQKHNTCTWQQKVQWISELDGLTKKLLFGQDFPGYGENTSGATVLQIPAPFSEAYLYYMESKIDYQNGEFTRFNNAYAMFRATWQRYADSVIREGKQLQTPGKFQ